MMKRKGYRIVAFLLAMLLVVSTIGSTPLTAYAQGNASEVETMTEEQLSEEVITEEATTEETADSEDVATEELPTEETTEEIPTEEVTTEEDTTEENSEDVLEEVVAEDGELAYVGDSVDANNLSISAMAMVEAGMEFTDANLIAIAEYWLEQEANFKYMSITYPNMPDAVSKDVWNALNGVLDDNYSSLCLSFLGDSNTCECRWSFETVTESISDINLDVDWSINNADEGITISFANVVYPAASVDFGIRLTSEDASYTAFCSALKDGDQTVLYDAFGKRLLMSSVYSSEDSMACLDIYDVEKLSANTVYTANGTDFTGRYEMSGESDLRLYFYEEDWETNEELVAMLQANKNLGIHNIEFEEDITENYKDVSVDVLNAAIEVLADAPESSEGYKPNIVFYTESGLRIRIDNPSGTVSGDTARFSLELAVNGEEVKLRKTVPEINADCVELYLQFDEESMADPLRETYPNAEDDVYLYVGEENYRASYVCNEYRNNFILDDALEPENDTWYEVKNYTGNIPSDVPGSINVDINNGRRTLYLYASEIDKQVFEDGDIATALTYYKEQIDAGEMERFNAVYIYQNATDKKIIYKSDYNFLTGLLKNTESDANISYRFDHFTEISGDYVENVISWDFYHLKVATKDVDVSDLTIKPMKNSVKVSFPANTYPAEDVYYTMRCDERVESAIDLSPSFHNQTGSSSDLFRIFSDPKTMTEFYPGSCTYNYSESLYSKVYNFCIYDVQSFDAKEYTIVKKLEDEPLYIGNTRQLETTFTPDKGSAVNWDYFTSYASVDKNGLLTPQMEGTAMYGASYLLDGEWTVDYWTAPVVKRVLSMKFVEGSATEPFEMEVGSLEQLDLACYPAGTTPDADELNWFVGTVADETVPATNVKLISDLFGNPNGFIEAVSEGDAIITVTHKEYPDVSAKIKIVVTSDLNAEMKEKAESLGTLYAFANIDKTLADIKLPEDSGFAWTDKTTSLVNLPQSETAEFQAVYTSKDGRTGYIKLPVKLINYEIQLSVFNSNGRGMDKTVVLEDGDKIYMEYTFFVISGEDTENSAILDEKLAELGMTWDYVFTSNPKNIVEASDNTFLGEKMFTAKASESGKKTITIEAVASDSKNDKKIVLAKENVNITVAKNPVADWDDVTVTKIVNSESKDYLETSFLGEKGELVFAQPKESAFALTIKSLDPKVCKIVKQYSPVEENDTVVTRVAYECPAGGAAMISVTAKDEMKSNNSYIFEVRDVNPRVLASAVTLDVNLTAERQKAALTWILGNETTILDDEVTLLLGENAGLFDIDGNTGDDVKIYMASENDNKINLVVELINPSAKKGKYNVAIKVPVLFDGGSKEFNTTVTINITDNKPKIKVNQTKKANLFYTDEEGYGYFTLIPPAGSTVIGVTLEAQANKSCDYIVQATGNPNIYAVMLKDSASEGKNKSGILKVELDDYREPVEVKFTVKSENKKPSLVPSKKTDTVYPKHFEDVTSNLYFTDKATGELIDNITTVEYKNGKNYSVIATDGSTVKGSKNHYQVSHTTDGLVFVLDKASAVAATDKFSLKVKGENWKEAVSVSYSIKVDVKEPKLTLSQKTVTLNINEHFYNNEVVYVDLGFKGTEGTKDSIERVYVYEYGSAAQCKEMKQWLDASYADGSVRISIANIDGMKKSSYTYKYEVVAVGKDYTYVVRDTLTVKLINTTPEKALSVSAKGNLDLLDRSKCITFTPKLTNVKGEVVIGKLVGMDADMFDYTFEDGVLKVYLLDDKDYSTKAKYSVGFAFEILTEDDEWTKITYGKTQTIKVKQGKPKLTIGSVTWYRDRQDEVSVPVSAVLNGKNVEIEGVELTNFNNDIEAVYEDGCIKLQWNGFDDITATGKTYNVKMNVYYADRALNEKPVTVTLKVTVK